MAKKRKPKQIILLSVSAIMIVSAIVITIICLIGNDKRKHRFENCETIQTKEQLLTALDGEEKDYVLLNIPMNGDDIKDNLGIITDKYMFLRYRYDKCRKKDSNERGILKSKYEWNSLNEEVVISDKLLLFEDVDAINEDDIMFEKVNRLDLNSDTVVKEALERCKDNYYYPEEVDEYEDNKRCSFEGVHNKTEVSFTAKIGNRSIKKIDDNMYINVVVKGGFDDLLKYDINQSSNDTIFIVWVLFGIIALCTFVFSIPDKKRK